MDSVINDAKALPFSDNDLMKLCEGPKNVSIVTYPELSKYDDLDHPDLLDGGRKCLILLYETKENYGHWCALFRLEHQLPTKDVPNPDTTLEFFDSYAIPIDGELKFVPKHYRKVSGQDDPHLTWLVKKAFREGKYTKLICNEKRLQKLISDTSTCGRWVGVRISFRHVPLPVFQSLFLGQKYDPDWYVTAMTLFIK